MVMVQEKSQEQTKTDWVHDLREDAGRAFDRNGLPTAKVEQWKYTSLKKFAGLDPKPDTHHARALSSESLPKPLLSGDDQELEAARLVVANGVYREDLSDKAMLPATVEVLSLDEALQRHPDIVQQFLAQKFDDKNQSVYALNTHFFTDGVFIRVSKGTQISHPIEIVTYTEGDEQSISTYPRHMIIVEEGAEATIVEHLCGHNVYLKNIAYDICVQSNARLHHYRWQEEAVNSTHLATTHLSVDRDGHYDGFTLTTGAQLARNEIHAQIIGTNATCRMNGAYLLKDKQHADTTIIVHHKEPHGISNQVFKGVLDDQAKGVFQGKIHVHKPAQKTDGYQLNNAILLSEKSEINVKPELEIYADDVKCSHGATTGKLDENPLFYLRSRGLNEEQAKTMLLQAFVGEVMEEIQSDSIRDVFTEFANQWLEKAIAQ